MAAPTRDEAWESVLRAHGVGVVAAAELGEDFDEHVAFVIAALQPRAGELGLAP